MTPMASKVDAARGASAVQGRRRAGIHGAQDMHAAQVTKPVVSSHRKHDAYEMMAFAYLVPDEIRSLREEFMVSLQELRHAYSNAMASKRITDHMLPDRDQTIVSLADSSAAEKEVLATLKLLSHAPEDACGLSLLHALFADILGRNTAAGKLFVTFVRKEFVRESWVRKDLQWLAMGMIIVMNLGTLYYIALKGISRGPNWQHKFLQVCFWNWMTEIMLIQSVDIIWVDFFLAGMVRSKVWNTLKAVVRACDHLMSVESHHHPDSSNYGVKMGGGVCSEILASMKPGLIESQITRHYYQHEGEQNAVMLKNGKPPPLLRMASMLSKKKVQPDPSQSVGVGLDSFVVTFFARMPLDIHRIFSSIMSTMSLAIFAFAWYNLGRIFIIVAAILFATVIASLVYLHFKHQHLFDHITLPLFVHPMKRRIVWIIFSVTLAAVRRVAMRKEMCKKH